MDVEMKRGGQLSREKDKAGMRAGLNDGGVLVVTNFVDESEGKVNVCESRQRVGLKYF